MNELGRKILVPRLGGTGGWITTVVRITAGVLFVTFSLGKFVDHSQEAMDFDRYGIPAANAMTYVVGSLELVCGMLLIAGLFTRVAAALLAGNMVGAISTAGRVEGGSFNLGVAPTMLVLMLFLVWAGAGMWSLDRRLVGRRELR